MDNFLIIQKMTAKINDTLVSLSDSEKETALIRLENMLKYWANETEKEKKKSNFNRFHHPISAG